MPNRIALPPSGPLLVVSPHLDDAALSCSVLLDRTEVVDVLTVFTGEPDPPLQGNWERLTGFADSAASMAARREEDRVAFHGSGHRVRYLDLLDYEYSPHPRASSESHLIARTVNEWADRVGAGVVAVPAGAGRRAGPVLGRIRTFLGTLGGVLTNPDHLLVRDATINALETRPRFDVLLYEELPYMFDRAADKEVSALSSNTPWHPTPHSVEVDRHRKADRIRAYRSQVPHLCPDGRRLDDPESLPRLERYWYLRHR